MTVDLDDLRPTLGNVGSVLLARTREDDEGIQTGTFSNATTPSDGKVNDFIDQALSLVKLKLGPRITEEVLAPARLAVSLRTAMMIELSIQPDQADGEDSAYGRLKDLYDELMGDLLDALGDVDEAPTTRYASLSIASPTLAHLPTEIREALQGPFV